MTWLLVWAVTVVAVDAMVIVRHDDDDHAVASRSRQAGSASTSPTSPGSSDGSTTTPDSATDGAPGDTTSDATSETAPDGGAAASTTAPAETTPNGEVVAAHLQGNGDAPNSATFHVDGHWQLRWHVEPGDGVAVTVDNDDDPDHQVLFAGLQPGDGSTDIGTGCNCTVHLSPAPPNGSGYDVVVVDVDG